MAEIKGTEAGETLNGTDENDTILGKGGDDIISDRLGNDIVRGGPGNDTFLLGSGADVFDGGEGVDTLVIELAPGFSLDSRFPNIAEVDLSLGSTGQKLNPSNRDIIQNIENITFISTDVAAEITGDTGNNIIKSGDMGDVILAGAGDDTINPGGGSDRVDGGTGFDNVILSNSRSQVTVTNDNDGTFTIKVGSDTLDITNVERLQLSDATIALDLDGTAGAGYRLYQAVFNRTPDEGGLGFWIKELDKGAFNLISMSQAFIGSPEFQQTYGTPETVSNDAFINLLYQNVLGRAAEGDGFIYWTGQLDGGVSRAFVTASFSDSQENKDQVASAIDDGIVFV